MPEPGISIIIPVRNDERRLANCLASLRGCDYPREQIEIIVADNGSIDGSAQAARDAGATVMSLPGLAVAQVRNRAAQSASRELLAFVDADHEVSPGWLRSAAESLSDSKVAAAGHAYLTPPGGTWVQRMYDSFRDRREGRFDTLWLGSGNLAVRRSVFLDLGGFDETLETCEDVDLCRRIRRNGWRLMSDSGMRSVHLGDPKTLRALFLGELWRGRDNLRVSLRPPIIASELPSIIIPIVELMLMVLFLIALVPLIFGAGVPIPFVAAENTRRAAGLVALGAVGIFAALAALRASRMLARLSPRRAGDVPRAFAVAVVYRSGASAGARAPCKSWGAAQSRLTNRICDVTLHVDCRPRPFVLAAHDELSRGPAALSPRAPQAPLRCDPRAPRRRSRRRLRRARVSRLPCDGRTGRRRLERRVGARGRTGGQPRRRRVVRRRGRETRGLPRSLRSVTRRRPES